MSGFWFSSFRELLANPSEQWSRQAQKKEKALAHPKRIVGICFEKKET
jgi:hypothetical protein